MAKFEKGKIPKGAKPFKKGKSGNPKGRPPKIPELTDLVNKVLGEEKKTTTGSVMTAMEAVVRGLLSKAVKGDVRAAEVLLNRAYGLPKQTIEADITSENTITIFEIPDNERE